MRDESFHLNKGLELEDQGQLAVRTLSLCHVNAFSSDNDFLRQDSNSNRLLVNPLKHHVRAFARPVRVADGDAVLAEAGVTVAPSPSDRYLKFRSRTRAAASTMAQRDARITRRWDPRYGAGECTLSLESVSRMKQRDHEPASAVRNASEMRAANARRPGTRNRTSIRP